MWRGGTEYSRGGYRGPTAYTFPAVWRMGWLFTGATSTKYAMSYDNRAGFSKNVSGREYFFIHHSLMAQSWQKVSVLPDIFMPLWLKISPWWTECPANIWFTIHNHYRNSIAGLANFLPDRLKFEAAGPNVRHTIWSFRQLCSWCTYPLETQLQTPLKLKTFKKLSPSTSAV